MTKSEIEKDFIAKKDSYFKNNYLKKTKLNYLRRYRNDLISNEISKIKNVDKVLDVGCGPAILYPEILGRCKEYYALDLVKSNLDKIQSQNNSRKIKFIQVDLDGFNPQKKQYDLIICSGSLEYTINPEEVIKKLIKCIKQNGTLIISLPNKNSPYRVWNEYVYKNFNLLRNFIFRKKNISYKRKLLTANAVKKVFYDSIKKENIIIKYFGVKLLLQPFDMIFRNLDYTIIKYFKDNPSKIFLKLCQEFIIVYKKEKD